MSEYVVPEMTYQFNPIGVPPHRLILKKKRTGHGRSKWTVSRFGKRQDVYSKRAYIKLRSACIHSFQRP